MGPCRFGRLAEIADRALDLLPYFLSAVPCSLSDPDPALPSSFAPVIFAEFCHESVAALTAFFLPVGDFFVMTNAIDRASPFMLHRLPDKIQLKGLQCGLWAGVF